MFLSFRKVSSCISVHVQSLHFFFEFVMAVVGGNDLFNGLVTFAKSFTKPSVMSSKTEEGSQFVWICRSGLICDLFNLVQDQFLGLLH